MSLGQKERSKHHEGLQLTKAKLSLVPGNKPDFGTQTQILLPENRARPRQSVEMDKQSLGSRAPSCWRTLVLTTETESYRVNVSLSSEERALKFPECIIIVDVAWMIPQCCKEGECASFPNGSRGDLHMVPFNLTQEQTVDAFHSTPSPPLHVPKDKSWSWETWGSPRVLKGCCSKGEDQQDGVRSWDICQISVTTNERPPP